MISISLNGQAVEIPEGTTALEAARESGLSLPTLCSHHRLPAIGACRMCVVEVDGADQLEAACTYNVQDGESIRTHSPRVLSARRTTMELLLARTGHSTGPWGSGSRFQEMVSEMGIRHQSYDVPSEAIAVDTSSPALHFNPNACIHCGLCVSVCNDVQDVHAINFSGRGTDQTIQAGLAQNLADTECNACGQCACVCPTGAFFEQDDTSEVFAALRDPSKVVIAAVMPAAAVGIGREFGLEEENDTSGQLVHGLKAAGFDLVFDASFGHDLAAMESTFELKSRITSGENLPLIVSSCPSLVKQVEHLYPELIPNLSRNKSPAQMFGRVLKSYYAEILERSAADVFVVQITACLSSKFERTRLELDGIDVALTIGETGRLVRTACGYDLATVEALPFDAPFGAASGAAAISDTSGGTAEAILRTIGELMTKQDIDESLCAGIRGTEPIREADVAIGNTTFRVAVAHELGYGNALLEKIKSAESPYHLVEIMACPGGCAGGGGIPASAESGSSEQITGSLRQVDESRTVRKPRSNRQLNQVYAEFLKAPFGDSARTHLQTDYTSRGRY